MTNYVKLFLDDCNNPIFDKIDMQDIVTTVLHKLGFIAMERDELSDDAYLAYACSLFQVEVRINEILNALIER